jgi:hypothetical protein
MNAGFRDYQAHCSGLVIYSAVSEMNRTVTGGVLRRSIRSADRVEYSVEVKAPVGSTKGENARSSDRAQSRPRDRVAEVGETSRKFSGCIRAIGDSTTLSGGSATRRNLPRAEGPARSKTAVETRESATWSISAAMLQDGYRTIFRLPPTPAPSTAAHQTEWPSHAAETRNVRILCFSEHPRDSTRDRQEETTDRIEFVSSFCREKFSGRWMRQ